MKLLEYQGKELFEKYGIATPKAVLVRQSVQEVSLSVPLVLKSQVPFGDRKKKGGIVFVEDKASLASELKKLFEKPIDGALPKEVLIEEVASFSQELYLSFSYDTDSRSPVLAVSLQGGSGIDAAKLFPIDLTTGVSGQFFKESLERAGVSNPSVVKIAHSLWEVFEKEQALLAEINPLFVLQDGSCVAGDAKIILDDNVANPSHRPFLDLPGDIAILASGGGASLLNLDILMHYGGNPANYVEYSGNPPASVVEELTVKVLSRPGLKGCWVVGGTANFTDIYETLLGFVQGLRKVDPKPTYPIVIRRDGPRQKEAFAMLKEVAEKEGYDFHLYGPETPMSESGRILVELVSKG
ncbi:MAG: ATP citrate lyase citrate-binding domain-containing protein [bacterium]|nr:ATP citrate lyase citrate-binding domain-containing protein [bacterium]MDZ4231665.1 ATP-grasp domain-containing protein [Candidatus Pacearchaeota archaeon]